MHEFSVAIGIIDTLRENGYLDGVSRVAKIKINLGKYSGIDKNYLSFAFQNVDDKRFNGAEIDFVLNDGDEITIKEIYVD